MEVSDEVIQFLRGAGPLEGVWFGAVPDGEKGAFWWRKYLQAAPQQPAASDVCAVCGQDRSMHQGKVAMYCPGYPSRWTPQQQPAADAGAGDVQRALAEAVAAIYFADNADYGSALWSVVKALGGKEAAELLGSDDEAAYQKYVEQVLK